jgi:CubicO group peptidase (beta-lactamase class C family)
MVPLKTWFLMTGIVLCCLGFICLPVGYGANPARDLSLFHNFADLGFFIPTGIMLFCAGLVVIILTFVVPIIFRCIRRLAAEETNKNGKDHARIRKVKLPLLWILFSGTALSARGATVDEVIAAEMKAHAIPGVSIAIIDDGRICKAQGYGNVDATGGAPVTIDTLFQAGSISKPVTALGALRLVEQGKLRLDDDINRKLHQWRVPENEFTKKEKVTLRRILSHGAGLTVHGFPGYESRAPMPTLLEILDGSAPANTAAIRVDVAPGSMWRYSGGGYTVLQQLMIEVSGRSFPDFMKETVLEPLQMKASTFDQPLPTDRAAFAATGHHTNGESVKGKWHIYPEMAAAGLWTTPSDLARLAIAIQQSLAGQSNPVISREMTREMLTMQNGKTGLGWELDRSGKALRFHHGGVDVGFDAFLIAGAESGKGVVVMINRNDHSGAVMRMIAAVGNDYGWSQGQ